MHCHHVDALTKRALRLVLALLTCLATEDGMPFAFVENASILITGKKAFTSFAVCVVSNSRNQLSPLCSVLFHSVPSVVILMLALSLLSFKAPLDLLDLQQPNTLQR